MELDEMKILWEDTQSEISKSINLDPGRLDNLTQRQMKSNLSFLFWKRLLESVFHLLAIAVIILCGINNSRSGNWLIVTGTLLSFYMMLFGNSLQQIRLIRAIDYGKDVVSIQTAMTALQVHSVTFVRLLFLFLPAILGWPIIASNLVNTYNLTWLSFIDLGELFTGEWFRIQLIATMAWLPVCIWLYWKLAPRNIGEPWVRNIIQKTMGKGVVRSMEYLAELRQP